MIFSEFLMKFRDLAAQADFQLHTKNLNPLFQKPLTKYRDELLGMHTYLNTVVDRGQPVTPALYREIMNRFAALNPQASAISEFIPALNTHLNELRNLEAAASGMDISSNKTLTDAFNSTIEKVVKLNSNPDYLGAASSRRFMVKVPNADGTVTEGFFTKDTPLFDYDPNGAVESILKQTLKDNPQDKTLASFVNNVLKNPEMSKSLIYCVLSDSRQAKNDVEDNPETLKFRGNKAVPDRLYGYSVELMRKLKLIDRNDVTLDDIKTNPTIMNLLKRVRDSYTNDERERMNTEFGQYHPQGKGIHATSGSTRAGRNYAFSKVAQLLGASDVIAKSTPMTAEFNGQHHRGFFMERAEGTAFDSERFNINDQARMLASDFGRLKNTSFDGEPLKQLAKIQILDYICQNIDRHSGNFLVKVDDKGKVTKITGIDNDLSFGTREDPEDKPISNDTLLKDILVIPKDMADIIQKLDKNILMATLADTGLSSNEILYAVDRFEKLKNHIDYNIPTHRTFKPNRISVVPDNNWASIKVEDIGTTKENKQEAARSNIFGLAWGIKKEMAEYNGLLKTSDMLQFKVKSLRSQKGPTEKKKFSESTTTKLVSKEGLQSHQAMLKKYLKAFNKTENIFQKKHTPYKNMKTMLSTLANAKVSDTILSQGERVEFEENLLKLENLVKNYIAYKAPQNDPRANGVTRLKEAKDLAEYLKLYRKSFHKAYNEMLDAEMDENTRELTEYARKCDQIANAIVKGVQKTKGKIGQTLLPGNAEAYIRTMPAFQSMTSLEKRPDGQTNLDYYNKYSQNRPENFFKEFAKLTKQLAEQNKNPEKAPQMEAPQKTGPQI